MATRRGHGRPEVDHVTNPDVQRARSQRKHTGLRSGRDAKTGHPAIFWTPPVVEMGHMPEGGGYPVGFFDFANRAMGVTDERAVLHMCSGSVVAPLTFDLRAVTSPACVADVRFLPVASASVRWVMADPPYGQDYAEALWGLGAEYPTPAALLREAARVLEPGGMVAFLHHVVPELPQSLDRIATFGISTGPGYRIRALTIAAKTPQGVLL